MSSSKQVKSLGAPKTQDTWVRPNLNWIGVPKADHTYDYSVDRMDRIYKKGAVPAPKFRNVKAQGIPDYWRKTYLVWPSG